MNNKLIINNYILSFFLKKKKKREFQFIFLPPASNAMHLQTYFLIKNKKIKNINFYI